MGPDREGLQARSGLGGSVPLSPQQVADLQRRNGLPEEPCWQIVFAMRAPDSRNPNDSTSDGGGVQAALAFGTLEELLNTPNDVLVKKMALSIAGRAAHEALEWVTMDGQLVSIPTDPRPTWTRRPRTSMSTSGTALPRTEPAPRECCRPGDQG